LVSFELTEDQKLIKETIFDFAKNELRPIARECDESGEIPESVLKKIWELGLLRNILPTEVGGFGEKRSVLTNCIIVEELAWGDLSLAIAGLSPSLFAIPVLEEGSEEQKKKYLPLFATDEMRYATLAVVEPKIKFDLSSLSTCAYLDGEEYVLAGEKCFVPFAKKADQILIFATTTPGIGYAGIDGFIVEKGTQGLKIKEREKNMGLKALETNEIELKEVRVPKRNILGENRKINFLKLVNSWRIGLSSMAVGVARAAYEYSRDYAKTRVAFGEPIASRQAIAFMIAEMAIEIDATRLLCWEAAWKMDRGEDASKEAYLTKRYADEMVLKVTDRGVQILGGHGYIREHPVELWLRNARGFAVWEGMVMI
jgi:alkylation response protein AidB-like acyl-CoA dehydrogenase